MSAVKSPTGRAVHQRVADQFAPAYLTLASIIQGVALTSLVTRVEATASSFTPSDWVLATASLVVIVAIWHEYLMMVLTYVWLPTLVDSAVPFGFLVTEVFMVHFLSADHRLWLLGYAAAYGVGVAVWGVQVRQVRMFNDENREVRDLMGRKARSRGLLAGGLALSSLLAAALYDVLRLDRWDLVVALLGVCGIGLFLTSSVPYFRLMQKHVNTSREKSAHVTDVATS